MAKYSDRVAAFIAGKLTPGLLRRLECVETAQPEALGKAIADATTADEQFRLRMLGLLSMTDTRISWVDAQGLEAIRRAARQLHSGD